MARRIESNKKVSLGRHRRQCSICLHIQRKEIEEAFIAWRSPATIASEYCLSDRATVYRHAHAFDLFKKRQRNVRAALEKIIERADDVEVTASAVVSAIQAYAKINDAGQWVERTETLSLNDLFDHMSTQELETYAQNGSLPAWFQERIGATPDNSENRGSYVQ